MKNFSLIILLFIAVKGFSQANMTHAEVLSHYQDGLRFLDKNESALSIAHFKKIQLVSDQFQIENLGFYKSEAKFYLNLIAAKASYLHAEEDLLALFENTHDAKKNIIAYHLAEYFFDKEQYEQAEKWYSLAPESLLNKEKLDQMRFKSAYAAMTLHQDKKALDLFAKIIEAPNKPYKNESNYYSGVIYFNQKNYPLAEQYLQAVRSNDQNKDVGFLMAQIQFVKKNYPEVIKILENDPHEIEGKKLLIGKSYFELKNYEQSQKFLLDHINGRGKVNADDMYQLAFSEYKNGNYKSAIEHFRELQMSKNFGAHSMYALADCYLKANDKPNALSAFVLANQYSQDPIISEESQYNMAKLNFELKNYNQSIKLFNSFNQTYPNSAHSKESWELLTKSLIFSNNYPQAIDIIEKNPQLQEGNEKLYQEICYTYAVHAFNSQDTTTALKYLKKAILNPESKPIEAEARYLRGEIYFSQSRLDEAMGEYNASFNVIEKNSILFAQNASLFNVHYGMAYCEYKKKNYDAALSQFQSCVKNYQYSQTNPISNMMQDVDLRIADILFIQKKYAAAQQQYSKISLARGEGYDYATLQKANIDGVNKNFKSKISTLTNLIKEVPNSTYVNEAKFQLGIAYEDEKDLTAAIKIYEEIAQNARSQEYKPKSLIRIATIYNNQLNYDLALKNYSKLVDNFSQAAEADQALKAIKEIYLTQNRPDEYIDFINKLPQAKHLAIGEQDTLLFEAGEELYANQNYDNAINIFNKYISKFPNGIFSSKAHFLKAESYVKKKMFVEAIEEFKILTVENNHPYYEKSLVKAAYYSYNTSKNYYQSSSFYQKLLAIASTTQNKQLAKIGLLESNFQLKKYAEVVEVAKMIETDETITPELKMEAKYYKAKSNFYLKNYKQAFPVLEQIITDKNSKRSAECTYYLAFILSQQNEFKKSNDILFQAKDDFGAYEYWVIKYFILIGSNYHKLKDDFQAKATLESIVNNYQGDESLLTEAKKMLEEINGKIKANSKVKYK